MKTYLALKNSHQTELPDQFKGDDVRYTEELVEYFLHEFTVEGNIVFDPFMGFGTTPVVAERLGRVGLGVEYDENRWRYAQSRLKHPERALLGDSTKLEAMRLPVLDFSITSPPYMGKQHRENPFTAYTTECAGYEQYLETVASIYRQLGERLKQGGRCVIEVSNLKHEDGTLTTLAWDIAGAVSQVLRFEGEIVIAWHDTYGYGYDHSYCLVFAKS